MLFACSFQDTIVVGGGISSTVSYTVMIGSQAFTGVTCDASNYCSLNVSDTQLSVTGFVTVSVVASNGVGSGDAVTSSRSKGDIL